MSQVTSEGQVAVVENVFVRDTPGRHATRRASILGAAFPAPGALASIPEEADFMDTVVPQSEKT